MSVQSKPLDSNAKRARPRIGFLRPSHIEGAFIVLLYTALLLLVVLSILGTFYGWRGQQAPLTRPLQIWTDIQSMAFVQALILQAVLSITQWGARQLSRHDRRWWMLYLAALVFSVYYNVQAYWIPLGELMPAYLAAVLIVAGDVLPEFIATRHE